MPRKEKEDNVKGETAGKVKRETTLAVIDLELEDDAEAILRAKAEIKAEIKKEKVNLYDKRKEKKKDKKDKDSKVKKEVKEDDKGRSRSRPKDNEKKEKKEKAKEKKEGKEKKARSRSGSRRREKKRSKSRSGSSGSSDGSSSSDSDPYVKFKPYTKVTLVNLVRKAELNGKGGQVVHPSCAVSPCPPGCILVRLDTGREIAVKPQNLRSMKAFHMTHQQSTLTQEERLQQVLRNIRCNVDTAFEGSSGGSGMIIDGQNGIQGGVGHMI